MPASGRVAGPGRGVAGRAIATLIPGTVPRGGGPSILGQRQEPLDADYTVVEEGGVALPAARPRGKRGLGAAPPRGLAALTRRRPGRGTGARLAALRSYEPYREYLGLLVDVWA